MMIAVLRETGAGEARVALLPDSVKKLVTPMVIYFALQSYLHFIGSIRSNQR